MQISRGALALFVIAFSPIAALAAPLAPPILSPAPVVDWTGFGSSQQVDEATGNTRGNLPVLASTVGAGVEYMANDLVALRAEYLHSHSLLDESTHLDSDACCNQTRAANTFRLGAAYFFH